MFFIVSVKAFSHEKGKGGFETAEHQPQPRRQNGQREGGDKHAERGHDRTWDSGGARR